MWGKRMRMSRRTGLLGSGESIYLAQDSDFSGAADGDFEYKGVEKELEIPHVIKGVSVTSYAYMFYQTSGRLVEKVVSTNSNITSMSNMFNRNSATVLDLSKFDTSSVTSMRNMFYNSSNSVLDLSGFDMSSVTDTNDMFKYCDATTGYARTQADADIFNASRDKPTRLTFIVKP